MERVRYTLAAPSAVYSGVGLHSGAGASVRLLPAAANAGLIFRDVQTGQEIPARAENVSDTSRCTRLAHTGIEVQTVEHILSALVGLGVDDAIIELSGGEVPAADGSAAPYVRMIQSAGLKPQGISVSTLVLQEMICVREGASYIIVSPAPCFQATIVLDYPRHSYIGTQAAVFESALDDYESMVAPARTFGFLSEIEALRARGLGLGATRDNAVVLGEEDYETPLRFPNELSRHKLLDLIGDLALIGRPLQASVVAVKPGHALNTRLAVLLSSQS